MPRIVQYSGYLFLILLSGSVHSEFRPHHFDSLCRQVESKQADLAINTLFEIWKGMSTTRIPIQDCNEAISWLDKISAMSFMSGLGFQQAEYLSRQVWLSRSKIEKDQLFQLYKEGKWDPFLRLLNKIWKNVPNGIFEKNYKAEAFQWIQLMKTSGAPDSSLRKAYMYLGNRFKNLNDSKAQMNCLLAAHALVQDKFCLDRWAWYIENDLAVAYNKSDNLEESLYYYHLLINSLEYFELFDSLSRAYTNLSRLYLTFNDLDNSRNFAHKGFELAQRTKNAQGIVANAAQLAEVLFYMDSTKQVRILLELADKARLKAPTSKFEENKHIVHRMFAKYYSKTGNWNKAQFYYASAGDQIDMNSLRPRGRAKLYDDWAQMLLSKGDTVQCREKLIKGLSEFWKGLNTLELESPLDSSFNDNTYTELFSTISDYYYHRYEKEKNGRFLKLSLQYLQWALLGYTQIQQQIATDPSKLTLISRNRNLTDKAIDRLYVWQQAGASDHELILLARAFLTAAKGKLLLEKSIIYQTVQKFEVSQQKRFQQLQQQAWWWMDQRSKSAHDEIFIQRELLKIHRTKSSMLKVTMQSSLQYDYPQNYLEYHLSKSSVYVAGQIKGQKFFRRIGRRNQLDSLMRICQKALFETNNMHYQKALKSMADLLLPIECKVLPKEIVIIPDGVLQQFPFEALVLEDGAYLLEKTQIWYEHAYGTLKDEEESSLQSKRMLVLMPQYPEAPEFNLLAHRGNEYALHYAQEELNGVSNAFKNKVTIDTSSNTGHLLQSMQKADLLHYIGHARSVGDDAYLVLPGAGNRISLEQLNAFYQPMQLVVLSACETGVGAWENGEGMRSLGKSFREAGARSVLMSLWAVSDQSTATIMTTFYQALSQGLSKANALRKAKLQYLQQSSFEKKHPFFWAGFVGYGE